MEAIVNSLFSQIYLLGFNIIGLILTENIGYRSLTMQLLLLTEGSYQSGKQSTLTKLRLLHTV